MSEDSCAALILAAGASKRLGHPKQLLRLNGETLLHRAARLATEAGCSPVVVVLGYEAEMLTPDLEGLNVQRVINQNWQQGMGSSLAGGIAAIEDAQDALLMVCDQVRLTRADLTHLLDLHRRSAASLTVSSYAGRLGVPAVFSRSYFPSLAALSGDRGARDIIERNRSRAAIYDFPDGAEDVDNAADWQRLADP